MKIARNFLLAAWQVGYAVSIANTIGLARLATRWTGPDAATWPGRDALFFWRWQVSRTVVQLQVKTLLWSAKILGMPGANGD